MISPRGFSDLFTFTRAAAADFLDEQGLIQSAAANVPRFEYDAMGNFKGLLLESVDTLNTTDVKWFNEEEGTFFIEADLTSVSGVQRIMLISDGASGESAGEILHNGSSFVHNYKHSGGTLHQAFLAGAPTANVFFKIALSYKGGVDTRSTLDGSAVTVVAITGTARGMTVFTLGDNPGLPSPMNGHIKEVRYYPRQLTDEELIALTAPDV